MSSSSLWGFDGTKLFLTLCVKSVTAENKLPVLPDFPCPFPTPGVHHPRGSREPAGAELRQRPGLQHRRNQAHQQRRDPGAAALWVPGWRKQHYLSDHQR